MQRNRLGTGLEISAAGKRRIRHPYLAGSNAPVFGFRVYKIGFGFRVCEIEFGFRVYKIKFGFRVRKNGWHLLYTQTFDEPNAELDSANHSNLLASWR